jgi:hypothetical protein
VRCSLILGWLSAPIDMVGRVFPSLILTTIGPDSVLVKLEHSNDLFSRGESARLTALLMGKNSLVSLKCLPGGFSSIKVDFVTFRSFCALLSSEIKQVSGLTVLLAVPSRHFFVFINRD